jgi:hypothetical protein
MAETNPDPNVDKTITGKEAWFNEDARFYKDVYIYGNLYYDSENSTQSLIVDNLTVNAQTILKDLNVSGVSTFTGQLFGNNSSFTGVSTFNSIKVSTLDIDNLVVGIATVQERFELSNENGTNHLVGFATGPRAGRIGIGSTTPEQKLDIDGAVKVLNIFDSTNTPGLNNFFLSRDQNGIRWVNSPPNAETDGIFVQNEGTLISGVTSFTTVNFIGTGSGDDLVFATANSASPTSIVDVSIISYWLADSNGIHTDRQVGINSAIPKADIQLDVDGDVDIVGDVGISTDLTVGGFLDVGSSADITNDLNVGAAATVGFLTVTNHAFISGLSTFTGFVNIDNNVDILSAVNVGGAATVAGTFVAEDIVKLEGPVFIGPELIVAGFTTGTISTALFANVSGVSTFAVSSGIATLAGIGSTAVTVETFTKDNDQFYFLPFVENNVGTFGEELGVDAGIKYNPGTNDFEVVNNLTVGAAITTGSIGVSAGATVGGATTLHSSLEVEGTSKFNKNVEFDSTITDLNGSIGVGAGKTDYRLASVVGGVSWRPPGVQTTNLIYVSVDGNDNNSGLLEGDAKSSIGSAAEVAQDGDTIYVRPGTYFENNPIGLRTDVSVSGQDLRLVTVVPINPSEDIFHVRRGCLVENMNFAGENVGVSHTGAGCVAFPPVGAATQNSGFIGAGPCNEGPSGRWRSPYIRNCTNFATGSIGMRINGDDALANFTGSVNLGQDLKSMVCDSFTQYNQNGIGVSVTNQAYAQLVSIFTINSQIGIFAGTGGQCDITNSNSSFGIYGLFADGTSSREFAGVVTTASAADSDVFELADVRDINSDVRKPFDGQGAFFMINLDDFTDVGGATGIVTEPMKTIRNVVVTNGGSGYSQSAPPNVTISTPQGPEPILAELSANVSAGGTVTSIDVVASGRNFLPTQQINIAFSGTGGAVAFANTDPILFTVSDASNVTNAGLTTVTFDQFVPYTVGKGTTCEFRRLSRIITSSHSFEYVGAGTDINRANPFQGGEPVPENEVLAINGGQIPFTSTDQKGNFRIGAGLVIDQTTASISGRDFNRAIQANLTPLILALGG